MRVALTAEGTYPHQFGGVSVWCDQLLRGLPDYDFTVVPLVATGAEPVQWKLPGNVRSMQPIPLWGPPPRVPLRARLSRGALSRGWASRLGIAPHTAYGGGPGGPQALVRELIDVLLSADDTAQHRFGNVLIELFIYAQRRDLGAVLAGEDAVRTLSQIWRERWPAILPTDPRANLIPGRSTASPIPGRPTASGLAPLPTLNDAVTAMQLIEHALRPLSHPPVQVDVVHAVTNGLGVLPALAAKWWYGLPMIVTEHGVYMREQYLHLRQSQFGWPVKDLYLRFLRRLCTLGYMQADVITPGNVYNRRWEVQLGADISRVRTVYNGVNPADFPALTDEPDVPTISWAGRIDPVKDLVTLLRAFALVVKQVPEARLRIFGSPPHGGKAYLRRCRAEAESLGIAEQATFEGRVPEIRDAYRAGNVVVLSSIIEGFPYTLIEAMACGRACVATDVGGVSEALADGAGVIVPPRNPAAMADACLRLLRDQALRSAIGAAARARALEHFTVDRAISAFDEMYSLLGTGRPIPSARLDTASEAAPDGSGPSATVLNRPSATAPDRLGPSAPGRWIALPPDEESTVIMPRLSAAPGDPTIAMPVMAGTARPEPPAPPAPEPSVPGRPVPPDQQQTMVLPVLSELTELAEDIRQ